MVQQTLGILLGIADSNKASEMQNGAVIETAVNKKECIPYPGLKFAVPTRNPSEPVTAGLDAIFIPTHRTTSVLDKQLAVYSRVASNVSVFVSKSAAQCQFATTGENGQRWTVVNLAENSHWQDKFFSLKSSCNPSGRYSSEYDLPLKRSLALLHSRQQGFRYIGLIDDDIVVSEAQVRTAAHLLRRGATLVGGYALSYPDVSVTDHIDRMITGNASETLVGGNCLFVDVNAVTGFFPYIYNEDWLFVLNNFHEDRCYSIGEVQHLPHTPWLDLPRVRFEQFGDLIIDVLLYQDSGKIAVPKIDANDWSYFITRRSEELEQLLRSTSDPTLTRALREAITAVSGILPKHCISFLDNWTIDCKNEAWTG
jgi:hypothetical protein